MSQAAIIFPGQGAQSVGMGRDIVSRSSSARRVFDRAGEVLGFDIGQLCFDGPADRLEQTDIQQPAIFVTSVAIWTAYCEAGGNLESFNRAGGLSLGEYSALQIAGAIRFEDAVRLVRRRGELMQAASIAQPGGMVSLVGADEDLANSLCAKARGPEILSPANLNCPGQVVIAGTKTACEGAMALANEFDCRAVPLAVAGAFHSPLMASAAEGLGPMLDQTEFRTPRIPVISNVSAEYHGDAKSIRELLKKQVTQPVLWHRCVERMIADGCERFVEIGPGRVLTGLMRKIDRSVHAMNISTAEGIDTALHVSLSRS